MTYVKKENQHAKQEGYGDENSMRQRWREEDHGADDEMDQQQCGDIDDEDYDQQLAAAGDDVAINPAQIQAELEEERPEMKSDSEEEEGQEGLDEEGKRLDGLDEEGKRMARIISGKPGKEKDKEQDEEGESDDQQAKDEDENGETRKKEAKKKPEKIIIRMPKAVISQPGGQKPGAGGGGGGASSGSSSSALGKRSTADASSVGGGASAAKKVKTEGDAGPARQLEEHVRAAMTADSKMCVRKLMDLLEIKKKPKETQSHFSEIVKKLCLATKQVILDDGPYKDQKIIKLRP